MKMGKKVKEKIKKGEKSSEPMVDPSNIANTEAKYEISAVMFDDEDSFGIIKAILNSNKKS